MTRHARQLAAAAASFDHASEPEPDWALEDRAEQIAREIAKNPDRVYDIDTEVFAAKVDDEVSQDAFSALADLHTTDPGRLIGGDALVRVLRIGRIFAAMRQDAIDQQARDEAEKEAAEFPRGFRGE